MDLADQPLLAFERRARLDLGPLDSLDRATEGIAKVVDFGRGAKAFGDRQRTILAGLIGGYHRLQSPQRPDQQAMHHPPADDRRRDPHQQRQEDQQLLERGDARAVDRQFRAHILLRDRQGHLECIGAVALARHHD